MTAFEENAETEAGRALFEELLWVHGMIRRDLDTVRRLAHEVESDMSPHVLVAELKDLKTNGRLWRLKLGCLRYCRFVHSHHGAEDALLFPVLRRTNPTISPVVDRLESDHRQVSDLLDAVEAAATTLTDADSAESRHRVAESLNALAGQLLDHLDFEELNAGPTIRRLREL